MRAYNLLHYIPLILYALGHMNVTQVKQRRLYEIIDVFRQGVHDKNQEEIGRVHVVR